MKLYLIKLINKVLDGLIWVTARFETRKRCSHPESAIVFEERRSWRNPWMVKMIPVCTVCAYEQEQQRLASGGW